MKHYRIYSFDPLLVMYLAGCAMIALDFVNIFPHALNASFLCISVIIHFVFLRTLLAAGGKDISNSLAAIVLSNALVWIFESVGAVAIVFTLTGKVQAARCLMAFMPAALVIMGFLFMKAAKAKKESKNVTSGTV